MTTKTLFVCVNFACDTFWELDRGLSVNFGAALRFCDRSEIVKLSVPTLWIPDFWHQN